MFTRDLRVCDNPMLVAAASTNRAVYPLFVLDAHLLELESIGPNRRAFLAESLRDLDTSLRRLGSRLHLRTGSWIDEVVQAAGMVNAAVVHMSSDVSELAQTRQQRLGERLEASGIELAVHNTVTVVPPGAIRPASGAEYKVFTPYYRRWCQAPRRVVLNPPEPLRSTPIGDLRAPTSDESTGSLEHVLRSTGLVHSDEELAPGRARGGETQARRLVDRWFESGISLYAELHDDLAADATSHLGPYLHFGCVSTHELVCTSEQHPHGAAFARQLCWRDFYHQILAARPEVARKDFRPRGDTWNHDPQAYEAWTRGKTGYPVVDAAMRQLLREGFVHNRARMVVASFLTKDLYLDWRLGARHFLKHLVDADVANNQLNWQWVAGTGSDTNPNRIFNPVLQGRRFDPNGDYIRRYVPELASLGDDVIHWPGPLDREVTGYPPPLVDHAEAIAAYRFATAPTRAR